MVMIGKEKFNLFGKLIYKFYVFALECCSDFEMNKVCKFGVFIILCSGN